MSRMQGIISAGLFLLTWNLCLAPRAEACLAEYRSLDWLAAESPLVFIGTVLRVEEHEPPAKRDANADADDREIAGPATLVVRVNRCLKGRCAEKELRIENGPIRSCSLILHFGSFVAGETLIFLLPEAPRGGQARLVWSGSTREMASLEAVEARLDRWMVYQARFLRNFKATSPRDFERALALQKDVRTLSVVWPPVWAKEETDEDRVLRKVSTRIETARLATRFAGESIVTLVGAEALERVEAGAGWADHPVWIGAFPVVKKRRDPAGQEIDRTREIANYGRTNIRQILSSARVEDRWIEGYLTSLSDDDLADSAQFPFVAPNAGRRDQLSPDSFNTEFILRFHCYDRGNMFSAYAMNPEQLVSLRAERVSEIIPALWKSSDGRLGNLARMAVERTPGLGFVPLVFEVQLDNDPHAWRTFLKHKQSEAALTALVETAQTTQEPWTIASFWQSLEKGECFEEPCLRAAINSLESSNKKETEGIDKSLRSYLRAAQASRAQEPPRVLSPAELRKWFEAHPAKPQE